MTNPNNEALCGTLVTTVADQTRLIADTRRERWFNAANALARGVDFDQVAEAMGEISGIRLAMDLRVWLLERDAYQLDEELRTRLSGMAKEIVPPPPPPPGPDYHRDVKLVLKYAAERGDDDEVRLTAQRALECQRQYLRDQLHALGALPTPRPQQ